MRMSKNHRKKIIGLMMLVAIMLVAVACGEAEPDLNEINDPGENEGEPNNGEIEENGNLNEENDNNGEVGENGDANGEASGGALERIQEEGVVTIGIANEAPYGYEDDNGEVTGASPEITRAVFERLGVTEIDFEIIDFGALIPALQSGRIDVATAGMDIRPERCEEADFAEVEMVYGEGMVVQAGNPHGLHSYEDIADNPDVTVSIMAGANQHDMLAALGVSEDQIETSDSIASDIAAVEAGRVDAAVMTDATALDAVESAGSDAIEFVEDFTQPVIDGEDVTAYGSAAFAQGNEDLVEAYNAELQELKDSGELEEILIETGFGPGNVPDGSVTTDDRCAG